MGNKSIYQTNSLIFYRGLINYLRMAYSLQDSGEQNTGNCVSRICRVVKRIFSLIKEVFFHRHTFSDSISNKKKLKDKFNEINAIDQNQKPICIYFVSSLYDNNGAILGNIAYYYHLYKIKNLQKYFKVLACLVKDEKQMKDFLSVNKKKYPKRDIKFVDIVSHGAQSSLSITKNLGSLGNSEITNEESEITKDVIDKDLFSDCANDATILLDACKTGLGDENIANTIARNTPGRKVFAPEKSMCFSIPIIKTKNNLDRKIDEVVHGLAIFNPFHCRQFWYQKDFAQNQK